jgi:hypothetical protein
MRYISAIQLDSFSQTSVNNDLLCETNKRVGTGPSVIGTLSGQKT